MKPPWKTWKPTKNHGKPWNHVTSLSWLTDRPFNKVIIFRDRQTDTHIIIIYISPSSPPEAPILSLSPICGNCGTGLGVGLTPSSCFRGLRDSEEWEFYFSGIVLKSGLLKYWSWLKFLISLPVDLGLPRPSSEGVFDLVWSKGVLRSLWGVTDLGRVITDHKDNNSDDYVQISGWGCVFW